MRGLEARWTQARWTSVHGLTLALLCAAAGCSSDDDGSTTGSGGSGGSGGSAASGGAAGAAGEGGCASPPLVNDIEVAGAYLDDFGGSHRIDDEQWRSGDARFHVLEVSNQQGWLVAQNDEENQYNPGLYSRFEWVTANGALHYCQSQFAAATEQAARDADRADADDLEAGCGGFAWSELSSITIQGSYTDDFGGSHTITRAAWLSGSSTFHLLGFSNDERWAIAQNDCDNPYNPGLYSRFEWVLGSGAGAGGQAGAGGEGGAGGRAASVTYFCQIGYDLGSAEAAESLEGADADDLEAGCSGFPWSELTPSGP